MFIINRIKILFCDFKCLVKKNKVHFIVSMAVIALSLFLAMTVKYETVDSCGCIACAIKAGVFNPFWFLLKLFLYLSIVYLMMFAASYHFVLFLINYIFITIVLFLNIKYAIIGIFVNPLCGVLYLVLYLIPLLFFNYFLIMNSILKIYDLSGYCSNKKHFVSYSCLYKVVFKNISNYIIWSLIISFCIFFLNIIVLSLIF